MLNPRKVTIIQPSANLPAFQTKTGIQKKRVCAYARVSTDQEDQINSYKAQIHEYTKRINDNPEWIFQGMYADEGLSGTSIKKRVQFLSMIDDARNGKIDLILTKSMSRFARNTVDSLTIIRELRNLGVEVFFEKENLYSSDSKVDFMLTIFSSIAQEESRNISENIKWGYRKRFKEGIVHINTNRFLGYDKDENGNIVINPQEAKTVKMIFNLYIAGYSTREIAEHLTKNNVVNGRGVVLWKPATITSILTNEKYSGDVILQKRVTVDYLSHKSVFNTGQAPQYHITNNHEAIIEKEVFMIVQNVKKERSGGPSMSRFAKRYLLSGMVYCGVCHRKMNRQHYNPHTPYSRIVMSCKNTNTKRCPCDSRPFDNETLERLSAYAFHQINEQRPALIKEMMALLEPNLVQGDYGVKIDETREAVIRIENEIKSLIQLRINNSTKEDDKYYQALFEEKKGQLNQLNQTRESLEKSMMDTQLNKERLTEIEAFLDSNNHLLSRDILTMVIKKIIVHSSSRVTFVLAKDDIEEDAFQAGMSALEDTDSLLDGTFTYDNHQIAWQMIEWGE